MDGLSIGLAPHPQTAKSASHRVVSIEDAHEQSLEIWLPRHLTGRAASRHRSGVGPRPVAVAAKARQLLNQGEGRRAVIIRLRTTITSTNVTSGGNKSRTGPGFVEFAPLAGS